MRAALRPTSRLHGRVEDGLGALKRQDRPHLAGDVRALFADSLDIDAAFQRGNEGANRWDYLLGHAASSALIALEPHSAKEDQISRVIAKKRAAKEQLAPHLKPGARVSRWLWVASGPVAFADTERARVRLDQNGIQFIGRTLLAKHLG